MLAGAPTGPTPPRARLGSALGGGGLRRPHTSSKALSAESRTPGRGFRGWPSFCQLSTGGGVAWLRHSRATDSLAMTDTFSSSPRMLGGTAEGTGEEGVGTADQPHLAAGSKRQGTGSHRLDDSRALSCGSLTLPSMTLSVQPQAETPTPEWGAGS